MQRHLGDEPPPGMSTGDSPRARLRAVRAVSALVTALSLAALGWMASSSAHTVTNRTVTKRTTVVRTAAGTSHVSVVAPVVQAAPLLSALAVPSADTGSLAPTPDPASDTLTPAAAVTTPAATDPSPVTPPASSAPTPAVLSTCPLPLPAAGVSGGLQSLVGFAPLFGPFTSEAFAAAPVFQPVFELFGPFLVAFANAYAAGEPSIAPLVNAVQTLETSGYAVISPLYGPYRSKFLDAESDLATALKPYATALVASPAAACVVDIEGALTGASAS
jgi:hypothetical protein